MAFGGGMHNNMAFGGGGDGFAGRQMVAPRAAQQQSAPAPSPQMPNVPMQGTPQTMAPPPQYGVQSGTPQYMIPPTTQSGTPQPMSIPNPGYRQLPIGVTNPPAPPTEPGTSATPPVPSQTVQQLPPGTATQPGNVAATAPMPYQTFGGIAQIDPSFASPQDQQAYLQQYQQMLQQSMSPYFQQQQQQLNSDLRARGIQDSGAAGYLEGNLLGQQGATLAGQVAPMVQQAFGYANQDVLANQGAANEAALYNANAYQNGVNQNYGAYNNYLNELMGLGGSNLGALEAAYLNSYGPSTGVQSGYNSALAGQQNVFGNVYGNAMNAQNQGMQNLGMMMAMGGG